MISFENKIVLVTGGSRGIGRACAEMLALNGASVAVNYRANADAANDVVQKAASAEQAGREETHRAPGHSEPRCGDPEVREGPHPEG